MTQKERVAYYWSLFEKEKKKNAGLESKLVELEKALAEMKAKNSRVSGDLETIRRMLLRMDGKYELLKHMFSPQLLNMAGMRERESYETYTQTEIKEYLERL